MTKRSQQKKKTDSARLHSKVSQIQQQGDLILYIISHLFVCIGWYGFKRDYGLHQRA